MQLEVWAQSVALTLKELLDPLAARVAALEQHDATMAALMARVGAREGRAPARGPSHSRPRRGGRCWGGGWRWRPGPRSPPRRGRRGRLGRRVGMASTEK